MAEGVNCASEEGVNGLDSFYAPRLVKLKSPEGTKGCAEGVKSDDLVNIFDFVLFFHTFLQIIWANLD